MAGQPFIAPTSPLDRRKLGKFEVLCRLSSGGMSEIFLAHQQGLAGFKKLVVLKTILPDIGGEEDFVRMFLDEARTTAAFNHPNIAQVYELDVDGGVLFMAMEFIQGCTLVEMARSCRQAKEPIPMGLTLMAVRDTALALNYAHGFTDARGRRQIVIHRDVAEKNIMVTYDGVTKLLDFGIAKALGRAAGGRTNIGMVKGTSGYMSPEQIRGEPLDPRSDIFSLGVVMHECLTGMRLFFGKNPEEGMLAALRESVQPPSAQNRQVTPEIDAVVMKALSRNREDRYATALEMARAIEKVAGSAIWHPEQCAEVVTRFFSDRRDETRRLLEAASFGTETTGEITIGSVLAKVKATSEQASPRASAPKEAPRATPPTKGKPRPSSAPVLAPEPTTNPTNPGAPLVQTSPARPRSVSASQPQPSPTPPIPPPKPMLVMDAPPVQRQPMLMDYDDESDAKTIPAAALPDEIRALRKRLQAQAAAREAHPDAATPAATPAVIPAVSSSGRSTQLATAPVTSPHGSGSHRAPEPPVNGQARRAGGTEPHDVLKPEEPRRTSSSETLSITGRAPPPWRNPADEITDEPAPKTKINRPFEEAPVVPGSLDADDLRPTIDRDPSYTGPKASTGLTDPESYSDIERAAVRRPVGLILAIIFLALLITGVGVAYLLDLLPTSFQQQAPPSPPTGEPAPK